MGGGVGWGGEREGGGRGRDLARARRPLCKQRPAWFTSALLPMAGGCVAAALHSARCGRGVCMPDGIGGSVCA